MNENNLHEYQISAIEHIMKVPRACLFLEMGLGKTVSTLTAISKLIYEELEIDSVLVIAPKRVAESVWSDELEKWEHLKNLSLKRIVGTEKQRLKAVSEKADIHIISRDNVVWLKNVCDEKAIKYDMLVIDELSSFKNHNSLRFKALKKWAFTFKRFVGLTGTPAPNGLIDLWSQMYLVDAGERLNRYIGVYRSEYFVPGKRRGDIVYSYNLKPGADKLIHSKIKDVCLSMSAKDYINLPPRIDNLIKLRFTKELMSRYLDFEKEHILMLLNKDDIAVTDATDLSNKLLQFANGAVYDEFKEYHEIHAEKIEVLKGIVEEAGGASVLIAYNFKSDLDRILKALKAYNPKKLENENDIKNWNSGKIRVLLMHPASAGHGLNLQSGGNIIVWFGQTWSLELEQQLNARLHRQGQAKPVFVYKIIIEGTIDEDVIRAQQHKTKTQDSLMLAMKARINYIKTKLI